MLRPALSMHPRAARGSDPGQLPDAAPGTSSIRQIAMTRFLNFVFYQVGWFACVLGLAWGWHWTGAGIAAVLVGLHFGLAADRGSQIRLACVAACLGLLVDTVQLVTGVFTFPHGSLVPWLPPACMTVLWMQFATTLRYSLGWLQGRYALAALFGLLGAPLAFSVGERLGAIEFLEPRAVHLAVLGVIWSLSVPLLVYVSDRLASQDKQASRYRWASLSLATEAVTDRCDSG